MRTSAFGLLGRDSRGVILIKFAIAFLPLLSVAAVATDVSRDLVVKQKFTNAVDAAALAAGRQFGRDDADITALAQGLSNAHYTAADVDANDYINDMLVTLARQQNGEMYLEAAVLNPGYDNCNCVTEAILPHANVKATINLAINAMTAACNTVIPEGLAWGWRALSPGPSFTESAPHHDQSTVKVVVLLSAAPNPISSTTGQNHSDFSACGLAAPEMARSGQQLTKKWLLDASDQHRYIYTIAFQGTDGAGATILQDFAPPPHEGLGNQRANIARGLNQLRLAN